MKRKAKPAYTIPITEEERERARKIRRGLEMFLREQSKLEDYLFVFFEHFEKLKNKRDIQLITVQVIKYNHGLKRKFSDYMDALSEMLVEYEGSFSSTKLDYMRDLLIENVRHIREEMIEFTSLLKDTKNETLFKDLSMSFGVIISLFDRVNQAVKKDWFGHIDYDILGRITLGYENMPMKLNKKGE